MKTITVSARSKTLNGLLKQAGRSGLILQSAKGHRFVLASIEGWQSYDVGVGVDFADEVKRTVRNKRLMKTLADRRRGGKRIPLANVKQELGLK
jgi:hypothetical protein